MKKLKIFEMFAGYGGTSFALNKAGIPFDCVGYSEIDKHAIKTYENNHYKWTGRIPAPNYSNKIIPKNYGDCRDINAEELLDFDLLTAGFPCQDCSIAGNRDLSKGRTMLINDVFRIVKVKKPKYIVLENVKGLLTMQPLWDNIRHTLKNLGYGVTYQVLNSSDYGIPQNRERVWIVCKLGGFEFMEFQFPYKEKLKIKVNDILEDDVEERYILEHHQLKKRGIDDVTPERDLIIQPRSDEGLRISRNICPTLYHEMRGWTEGLYNTFIIFDGKSWRVFTEKEVFRLMGFMKDQIKITKTKRDYKIAGNGWDINIASKIFKKLLTR